VGVARDHKLEMYAAIRRDSRREGLSVRALAKKYRVHRRTVREALASAFPAPRKKPPPRSSRLDLFKPVIDQILWTDLDAPRKQRHTVRRIFNRLVAEREMEGISYSTVANYVAWRKPQIMAEAGRGSAPEVPIDQVHRPGVEAEVDFGDVWINLAGTMTKCFLFVFRLSYSGKAVHRVTASAGQEAFFEGHVHAFRVLGGYVGDNSSAISCCRSGWSLQSRSSDGLAAAVGTTCRCRGEPRGVARTRLGRRLPGVRGGTLSAEHPARHRL
jgi:transposase